MYMKNILLIGALLIVLIGGAYFLMSGEGDTYMNENVPETIPQVETTEPSAEVEPEEPMEEVAPVAGPIEVIGTSVEGNNITAYHFGEGDTEILFLSGIHGGYSWNTSLLGFELVDWFKANADKIPKGVKVTVIPALNPDGLKKVTGSADRFIASSVSNSDTVKVAGRFNASGVDLNRNFECEWKETGTWQNTDVSGGKAPFSEPETQAIRDYVISNSPKAIVTWYSAAGGVYSSNCGAGPSAETISLTNTFAKASGYKAYEEFDYYEITGDMVNWFAKQNIPAISVLLTNREQTEFSKNIAGVQAVLNQYAD
jgi:hypothetical protein